MEILQTVLLAAIFAACCIINAKLNQLERRISTMPDEQELDSALADLKTEINAAADRVLKKIDDLTKNNPDLTDEIADIRGDIESLKAIAPATEPPPQP